MWQLLKWDISTFLFQFFDMRLLFLLTALCADIRSVPMHTFSTVNHILLYCDYCAIMVHLLPLVSYTRVIIYTTTWTEAVYGAAKCHSSAIKLTPLVSILCSHSSTCEFHVNLPFKKLIQTGLFSCTCWYIHTHLHIAWSMLRFREVICIVMCVCLK